MGNGKRGRTPSYAGRHDPHAKHHLYATYLNSQVCKKAGCIKMASGNFAMVVPVDETFEMFRGLLIPFHSDVVNE
jgi:D-Tyr-tRNAtyr deacylase